MVARVALVLLAASLPLACGGKGPPEDAPNLLIVTVDTLRADSMGVYGSTRWGRSPTPHGDALAARGMVFDRCYAPRGQTHPSLASMITGLYPATHGLRENALALGAEHESMFERLRLAGWRTGIFIANFATQDPGDNWIYRGADAASDGWGGRLRPREAGPREAAWQRVWDDRVESAAMAFLERVPRDAPFAAWVHFYDVHKPYNPPPEFAGTYPTHPELPALLRDPGADSGPALEAYLADITLGDRPVHPAELAAVRAMYDATVTATDARLGRLLARLEELGVADDTIVVLSADHGEELFDHNRYFFHGSSIYDGTLRIPLIVRGPGLAAGARTDALAQNVDLAPTLLDLLGVDAPPAVEGRSLAPLLRGETTASPRLYAFIEWQDLIFAATDGRHTYVDNRHHVWPRKPPYYRGPEDHPDGPPGFAIACFEAYDLQADPGQRSNLLAGLDPALLVRDADALPEPIRPLRRALEAFLKDPRHRAPMDTRVSPARIEQLRQLGYVGSDAERTDVHRAGDCPPPR